MCKCLDGIEIRYEAYVFVIVQLNLAPGGPEDPTGIPNFLSKAMTPPHPKSVLSKYIFCCVVIITGTKLFILFLSCPTLRFLILL